MKATINAKNSTGINISHRKEDRFTSQLSAVVFNQETGATREAVTLRFYTTDCRSYACIWANNGREWVNGSGFAGGYGYNRASEAASRAITAAGITIDEEIGGRGDSHVEYAVEAIASALYPGWIVRIIEAHA